jgi:hypothetical protein
MIAMRAIVSNEDGGIPKESATYLQNIMQKVLVSDGFANNNETERFALIAKCDILSKDVVQSTPVRISQKMELSFIVVDLLENRLFESCTIYVSGIGTNETKAYQTAFQNISKSNNKLREMLGQAKDKIIEYYSSSCSEIMRTAQTMAATGDFNKGIYLLMSVPNVCSECFTQCQQLATSLYQAKIDNDCASLLEQAKNKWAADKSAGSATEIADILCRISPNATNYDSVVNFRESIETKLAADAKRDWTFKLQQYADQQAYKRSVLQACKDVSMEYAKNFKVYQYNKYILF